HNLLRLFLLEERARKPDPGQRDSLPKRIAVIGAGTMGAGIGFWASSRGLDIALADTDVEALGRARKRIAKLYENAVRRGTLPAGVAQENQARIQFEGDLKIAVDQAGIVIEAVVEKMGVKREVFKTLDLLAPQGTILATNTSALSVSELAAATGRP